MTWLIPEMLLPQTAKDVAQGSCSRNNLRTAQRMFAALLGVTLAVCLLLEAFFLPQGFTPPAYTRELTFVTVESGDGRRLGNIMFSYAALIGISNRHNMTPAMISGKQFPLPSFFGITAHLTDNIPNTLGMYTDYTEFGRRACAYDMGVEKLPHTATRLWGFYQSWKYFEGWEKEVREEFKFLPQVGEDAQRFIRDDVLGGNDKKEGILVGIHVRRGDIIQSYFRDYGYTTPDKDYYQRAIQKVHQDHGNNIHFVVCSDDIEWAKDNLKDLDPHIHFSEGRKDYQDLAILSMCDHTIISVGSFGWWAGWLAGGTVVYYDKWPREFSKLEYHINKRQYFLPTWIPLR